MTKSGRLLLLLLLVLVSWRSTSAQSAFVFQDPLRSTYFARGPAANTATFLVTSKTGTISNVSASLRSVKDGDGQALLREAVTVALSSDQVTEDGVDVTLKLNPAFFSKAGEYSVIISFQGTGSDQQPVKAMASMVIVHPAADINLDQLKDQTIEVYRSFPFGRAEQTFQIYLEETTGKSDLADVQASGQAIFYKDTKTVVPGQLVVTREKEVPEGQAAAALPGSLKLNVHVKDLERAGSFETGVVVNSPSLATRKVIPLRLTVSDCVIWPLLVILAGVVGGFLTNNLAGSWRARHINKRTILRLQSDASRFRQLVKAPERALKIEEIWRRLRIAEDNNELGDTAKVKTDLEQIEKDLADFHKELVKAKADLQTKLNDVQNQLDAYSRQFSPLSTDEERDVHAIGDRLTDARRLLKQDQVDYAGERLDSVQLLLNDLRKSRLTKYFDDLKRQFETLKEKTTPADHADSLRIIGEAGALLSQGDLGNAFTKLGELKSAIEILSDRATRGGRETRRVTLESPPAPPERMLRTRIDIKTAREDCSTDRLIEFQIIDSEGLLQPNDVIRWNFGEPGSQTDGGPQVSYQYREFGDYDVQVEVLRGNNPVLTLEAPLTILPGKAARSSEKILESIRRSDILLSVVALVLASLTGVLMLYVGKAFGTLSDYLLALLWGFGIDNSIRGFAAVMGKIRSTGGAE